jgi:signal transduction histidine kinase
MNSFNLFKTCKRKYNVPLWQCPQFMFVMMGIVIMASSLFFYALGQRYLIQPEVLALIVMLIATVLLVIAFVVTRSFEGLAETNKVKDEFINIVSHQLRSPLTSLRWASQFLSKHKENNLDPNTCIEYFDLIKENSIRMEKLIDDLLIITRLNDQKVDKRKANFSLSDLVHEVVKEYETVANRFNIKIKVDQEDIPLVYSNEYLIRIVLRNLIDNALSYSLENSEIKINFKNKGKKLGITITDHGVGIPKDVKKRIFEKFFRAKNVIHKKVHGTGLGLYICKLIMNTLKEKIWFTSKEGESTTFGFSLSINN